jgi:hypothetical protein
MPGIVAFEGFAGERAALGFVARVAVGFFDVGVDFAFDFGGDFAGAGFALVGDGIGIFIPGMPGM